MVQSSQARRKRGERASMTRQISEAIKGQIAVSMYGPGACLPSARILAAELVSRTIAIRPS